MFKKALLILMIPAISVSQDGIVERIKQRYEEIESIHAKLTQVYHWKGFDTTQSFMGEVWLKRPDRLRVRLSNDEEHHLISCADTAWLYSPALNQAILTHHPSEVLLDIFNLDNYRIDSKLNGKYILVLIPKKENSYFERITLYVERENLMIKQITLLDLAGNTTEWLLRDIEVNPELPDSLFHFSPPPDVEIIEG